MQKEHRKLAAIMFTDIVGYTALMGKNEQNALGILHRRCRISHPGEKCLLETGRRNGTADTRQILLIVHNFHRAVKGELDDGIDLVLKDFRQGAGLWLPTDRIDQTLPARR